MPGDWRTRAVARHELNTLPRAHSCSCCDRLSFGPRSRVYFAWLFVRVCGLQLPRTIGSNLTQHSSLSEGAFVMAATWNRIDPDENRDPITGETGAHPVGAGVGAAVGGALAGAAAGIAAG